MTFVLINNYGDRGGVPSSDDGFEWGYLFQMVNVSDGAKADYLLLWIKSKETTLLPQQNDGVPR